MFVGSLDTECPCLHFLNQHYSIWQESGQKILLVIWLWTQGVFFCVRPWSDTYKWYCMYVCLAEFLNFYFTTVYPVTGWFLWDIQPYASDLKFVGYTGVTWVVPWDHFGRTQGSFYGYSGITLRVLWDHFGFTFGTTLRVVWGHFEGTLQVLRGGTLGSLRGYPGGDFGSTLG